MKKVVKTSSKLKFNNKKHYLEFFIIPLYVKPGKFDKKQINKTAKPRKGFNKKYYVGKLIYFPKKKKIFCFLKLSKLFFFLARGLVINLSLKIRGLFPLNKEVFEKKVLDFLL